MVHNTTEQECLSPKASNAIVLIDGFIYDVGYRLKGVGHRKAMIGNYNYVGIGIVDGTCSMIFRY